MIFVGSRLSVFDNSGGRVAGCIRILGVGGRPYAMAGDLIVVSLKSINPKKKLSKGQILKGIVISTIKSVKRIGGECVRFDRNGIVLVNDKHAPIGTRVLSSVMLEVRVRGFIKILSLSRDTI